ncbi:MAG: MFS transporter, partial [Gemmatimonas sp. SG8_17]
MCSKPGKTLSRVLQRIVDVRDDEIRALILSAAYFFCILSAYYVIRPIRDEMGVAGGVRNLPWLFTGTLLSMLILNPIFAGLVVKFSRRRFVSMTYRFFIANLIIFFVALQVLPQSYQVWIGRTLFVWTSVFNLFVVSIFWAFMADVFRTGQSKRLFGFIGVGGTLGGLFGAAITASLVHRLGAANLLLISAMLLEMAVLFVRQLSDLFSSLRRARGIDSDEEQPIGGSVLAGFSHVVRSPYLLGICGYMLMYTLASTTLYFHQAQIADQYFLDRAARTAFFAKLDFAVNALAIVTQVFLTGRIIKVLGVAMTLALLPALCVVGFTAFGLLPTLAILIVFQVLRRAGEFAVARPTRETLYTVVSREDRYKAKSLIDTFVYRSGDQIAAWSYTLVTWLGLSMAAISFAVAPLAGVWLLIGLWLGRRQHSIERQQASGETRQVGGATHG